MKEKNSNIFGEYTVLDEDDSDPKHFQSYAYLNNKAVEHALNQDYVLAIQYFEEAKSCKDATSAVYRNSALVFLEIAFFDVQISLANNLDSRSFEDVKEALQTLNKIVDLASVSID